MIRAADPEACALPPAVTFCVPVREAPLAVRFGHALAGASGHRCRYYTLAARHGSGRRGGRPRATEGWQHHAVRRSAPARNAPRSVPRGADRLATRRVRACRHLRRRRHADDHSAANAGPDDGGGHPRVADRLQPRVQLAEPCTGRAGGRRQPCSQPCAVHEPGRRSDGHARSSRHGGRERRARGVPAAPAHVDADPAEPGREANRGARPRPDAVSCEHAAGPNTGAGDHQSRRRQPQYRRAVGRRPTRFHRGATVDASPWRPVRRPY